MTEQLQAGVGLKELMEGRICENKLLDIKFEYVWVRDGVQPGQVY